jgi:hypothetical protein
MVFGEIDSFREEVVDGLLDDLLFVHFWNEALIFLYRFFLVLTVSSRALISK